MDVCVDGEIVSNIIRKTQAEQQKAKKGTMRDEAGHLFTLQILTEHELYTRWFLMRPRSLPHEDWDRRGPVCSLQGLRAQEGHSQLKLHRGAFWSPGAELRPKVVLPLKALYLL